MVFLYLTKFKRIMRKVFGVLSVLFLLFSCEEVIKKESKLVVENAFEDIQFVKPKVTNSSVVDSVSDLLGYWVGDFKANLLEDQIDSIYDNEKYIHLITRKITFSIDEIKGDSIIGHSITAGNISPFKGVIKDNEKYFSFIVDEVKRERTDGQFNVSIDKKDSILKGNWTAFYPDSVKISSRIFDLKKRFFKYDKNNKLSYYFYDTDKFREFEYLTDTINGEVEVYSEQEYFATTEKVLKKNASVELLDKEFVSNLTKADIFILRNSIFARHGFAFRDKQLRMYFEEYDWYMPVFGDVKDDLTEIERQNIELLLRYEKNAEEYYDTFGR